MFALENDCLVWSGANSLGSIQGEHGDHRDVDTSKMRHRGQRQGNIAVKILSFRYLLQIKLN